MKQKKIQDFNDQREILNFLGAWKSRVRAAQDLLFDGGKAKKAKKPPL